MKTDRKKVTINQYIKEHKLYMLLFVLSIIGISFVAPLKSFILQWLIDADSKTEAIHYLVVGCIITILSFVIETICRNLFSNIQCKSISMIRNNIMKYILHRNIAIENEEQTGDYISIETNDMQIISNDYFSSLFSIMIYGGMLFFALCMYIYIDITMLLFVALAAIIPLVLPRFIDGKIKKARTEYSSKISVYTEKVKEILTGFSVIHNFGVEKHFQAVHNNESEHTGNCEYRFYKYNNLSMTSSSFICNILFFIVLLFGMFLVFDHRITLGYMVAATNLSNFIIAPCQVVSSSYGRLKASKQVINKIETMLNAENNEEDLVDDIHKIEKIQISKLSFAYKKQTKKILDEVDLQWNMENRKIAVIGASGIGKSTLAKLIHKYSNDYMGEIRINDRSIMNIPRNKLYEKIGYITQTSYIFNDTIKNNITLYEEFDESEIDSAIRKAGLADYIASLPEGINTMLNENGKSISGGQQQRIALARVLMRGYQVIIADEVTSNLDVKTGEYIMQTLLEDHCLLLVITHSIHSDFMNKFDSIYKMENGKLKLESSIVNQNA